MNKEEAQAIADKLGLRYDGVQEWLGHQFTDIGVTGTTFYGNTLEEIKRELVKKRKLFKQLG